MRATHVAIISLIVGLAVFFAQGGLEPWRVHWHSPITAEAANAAEMKSSPTRDDLRTNAQELEAEADAYDEQADEIQAQVRKYKHLAAAMTTAVDPKGFRRDAFIMAAGSQSRAVAEMRQLAAQHRAESKRLLAKLEAH